MSLDAAAARRAGLAARWAGRLALALRDRLGLPRWYEVGGVRLQLPAGHALPEYQAAFPRYDRFLRHLAAGLQPGDAVIDVGANVGDTLAALLAGCPELQLLAIEPEPGFFALLQANAVRLQAAHPGATLVLQQALVGVGSEGRVLVGTGGTRHAVASQDPRALRPQSLVTLVAAAGAGFAERLRLVKSDVDGWDHEVLVSALPLLLQYRPLVHVECLAADARARDAYVAVIGQLLRGGYRHLHLFDNFGNPLASAEDADTLGGWLDRLLDPGSAPGFHYLDVLVASPADEALVQRALAAHLAGRTEV